MNDLLVVLNPRDIAECVLTISALDIDQAWCTGYTEHELEPIIAQLVERTDHDHYIVIADDTIPTQPALDAVQQLLHDGHPIVTGYCNLDTTGDTRVNLTRSPLTEPRTMRSYDFYTQAQVDEHPDDPVPTHFAGFALTGMSRTMWQRYPFKAYGNPGCSSDFHLSMRLAADGWIPIVAPKAGRIHHVKDLVNTLDRDPRKLSLVGKVTPDVIMHRRAIATPQPHPGPAPAGLGHPETLRRSHA